VKTSKRLFTGMVMIDIKFTAQDAFLE